MQVRDGESVCLTVSHLKQPTSPFYDNESARNLGCWTNNDTIKPLLHAAARAVQVNAATIRRWDPSEVRQGTLEAAAAAILQLQPARLSFHCQGALVLHNRWP